MRATIALATLAAVVGCGGSQKQAAPEPEAGEKVAQATPADPTRLYPGAPPVLPHPTTGDFDLDCLDCHYDGGDVGFDNPAPASPHPEQVYCRQCHVPRKTDAVQVASEFTTDWGRRRSQRLYATAPPPIPHQAGPLHQKCLACHGGEAPQGPVTSHPERTLCRQCHVPTGGEP